MISMAVAADLVMYQRDLIGRQVGRVEIIEQLAF
jgi:hypothetical protein